MKIIKNSIRVLTAVLAAFVAVIFGFIIYADDALPDKVYMQGGRAAFYNLFTLDGGSEESVDYQSAQRVSEEKQELMLLGVIPVNEKAVVQQNSQTVQVSGSSFGIKLYTNGVIVVGTRDIAVNGKTVNPSKEAGILIGDIIVSINSKKVFESSQVEDILNDNNGESYEIKVNRGGRLQTLTLTPVYVDNEECYKAGMWVRDSTAGIGTITFFDESSGKMAALGHPITDVDTGEIMPLLNGEAVETKVTSVIKSSGAETGSICCDFLKTKLASLDDNTHYGVYGRYTQSVDLSSCSPYQIALPQEAERGFCQILTTIDESGPQLFSAEITRIYYNDEEKNMVIRITDDALIDKTGGIVQGMSGTPIIQNGKLIGAITHVIINNPLKGYAVFAHTMLEQCAE